LRAESIGVIQKNVGTMVRLRRRFSVSYGQSGASSGLKSGFFEEGTESSKGHRGIGMYASFKETNCCCYQRSIKSSAVSLLSEMKRRMWRRPPAKHVSLGNPRFKLVIQLPIPRNCRFSLESFCGDVMTRHRENKHKMQMSRDRPG
jgi:hypothetical protein